MELENVNSIIKLGMNYERARVEAAAHNLAMANVALAPGAQASLMTATVRPDFAGQIGLPGVDMQTVNSSETRVEHDPSNPLADAQGMVHYPKLDPAMEMATLTSATRAYEADVRAYNSLHAMMQKAFEIGK